MKRLSFNTNFKNNINHNFSSIRRIRNQVASPFKSNITLKFPTKKKMSYPMAWMKTGLRPFGNIDRDRVPNVFDCKPFNKFKQEAVYRKAIGMLSIDRPRRCSCTHATPFCATHCYNIKFESGETYGEQSAKDIKKSQARYEQHWKGWSGEDWKKNIEEEMFTKKGEVRTKSGKLMQTKRVRLMSSGEAFAREEDIPRVKEILQKNPERTFWIPTRAWHKPKLKEKIEKEIESEPNVRVLYSTDPSDIESGEYEKTKGHATMHIHPKEEKEIPTHDPMGRKYTRCPKTFEHKSGYCAECEEGCFNEDEEVHVQLKEH